MIPIRQSVKETILSLPTLSATKAAPGIETRVLGADALDALAPQWAARVEACDRATVFSGPLFQTALARVFFPDLPRRAVAVFRGAALAGLLPLMPLPLRQGPMTLREAGFARNPHTLRNHLLCDPDPDTVGGLLAAALGAVSSDTLLLQNLPDAGGTLALCADAAQRLGCRVDPPTPGRTLMVCDFEGSYDDYLATRSGQFRRQIRKRRRDLEAAGALSIPALSGAAITAAMPAWRAVVAASWQGQADEGEDMSQATWAFHESLAACGRLWIAYLDGRPIAALRMLEDSRAAYVHTMHFDPAMRELAPGVVIFDAMMRDAARRGVARVDFNGANHFFSRWATGSLAHSTLRIYRNTLRGRAGRMARRLLAARRAAGQPKQA